MAKKTQPLLVFEQRALQQTGGILIEIGHIGLIGEEVSKADLLFPKFASQYSTVVVTFFFELTSTLSKPCCRPAMPLGTNIIPRPQTKKPGTRTLKFTASMWPLGLQLISIYLTLSQHHRKFSSRLQVALGDTVLDWQFPPSSPVAVLCC